MTYRGFFITGTGTGVGKTFFTVSLTAALRAAGRSVCAVKPVETGCDPEPADALALAEACGRPELARFDGFYRAKAALAPFAATLLGEPAPPSVGRLAEAVLAASRPDDVLLIEGAGGFLTPLDERHTIADLAVALELPLIVVAVNALGTISHTLSTVEAAWHRGLCVHCVVLSRLGADASTETNANALSAHLRCRLFNTRERDDLLTVVDSCFSCSGPQPRPLF